MKPELTEAERRHQAGVALLNALDSVESLGFDISFLGRPDVPMVARDALLYFLFVPSKEQRNDE